MIHDSFAVRGKQIALKAVKASVEAGEVTRYESYDAKHGAHYVGDVAGGNATSDDDWDVNSTSDRMTA
jgi:hypothetical protein